MTIAKMFRGAVTLCLPLMLACQALAADPWVTYEGNEGPGKGKHIVLISGDEEYRSEEALPMLARILAVRHGFKTTVLFAIDPKTGEIDPGKTDHIPGLEALKTADLMVIATRFRNLPDEQMQHIADYLATGKPVIGLRTATHAFNVPKDRKFHRWSFNYGGKDFEKGFGQQILGQTWVNHHGHHGKQGTRGTAAPGAAEHPILRGIGPKEMFGDSDVYTVTLPLPEGCQPLVLGQVLTGMKPDDAPLPGPKNDPMMPIVWLRDYIYEGRKGKALCSTLGAATDLTAAGSRRMLVNAVYFLLGMTDRIPGEGTAVELVGAYQPSPFRFGGFKRGVKPADLALPAASSNNAGAANKGDGGVRLELKAGDHIAIIGNALAERMQHDGFLEARLQTRFPTHKLSLRNLGFSGDEVVTRARSASFGSPNEWLKRVEANVVIAMFGFGESFRGAAGLEAFKRDLAQMIQHMQSQKYNGQEAPRIVLVSPLRFENLKDPHLPDGVEHNARLKLYSEAMGQVARELQVPFVDLFTLSGTIMEGAKQPLTINGVHLTERGNEQIAAAIDEALFSPAGAINAERFAKLRGAIQDKNFHWFHRYRTTDGYSVYGGRSGLRFVGGQSNRDVAQREMAILDAMAANRDARIWAVAQGGDLMIDDSNTPPFLEVKTNKPGAGPNGKHIFLSGEESVKRMTVAPGLKVSLFASEEQFPELINPVQMAWDTKGRLWVCAWPSYPHWKPKDKMDDKLLILEDTDGDGKADRCKTFAGGLHNPTGFELVAGGVLVANAPDLIFLKDTDGDDVADLRQRVLHGIDSADTHHTASSFVYGPDGYIYFQEGVFHRSQIETPYGVVRNVDAAVWRFDPKTYQVERYCPYPFANPHGHVVDCWGQSYVYDGTGAEPYHATLISGYLDYPHQHLRAPQLYRRRTRPCPGVEILSSRHFPEKNQGNLLVANVIGFQGILQYVLRPQDSSYVGSEVEPIIHSNDPNFRPVDIEMAPDGSMYFTDWQNPLIGHMQHNLRDPSRDQTHGRVYRIVAEGRPLLKPEQIAGQPIDKLLELLKSPEDRVRYRVRIELSGRPSGDVLAAVDRWVSALDPKDADLEHHLLEALWLNQQHHRFNGSLLQRVLNSAEPRARAAAVRVLCDQRGDNPSALDWLKQRAADGHPLVRLEAVRAASYFRTAEAVEVVLISEEYPTDPYLDFVRKQTMRSLEPLWKQALAEGKKIRFTTPTGLRHFLRNVNTEQLLAMPRDRGVYLELLYRNGVADEHRRAALAGLAVLEKRREVDVLLDAIGGLDAKQQGQGVAFDLVRLLSGRKRKELAEVRPRLREMATKAALPIVRQIGFVALIVADGNVNEAWQLAQQSAPRMLDLISAMRLIPDPNVKVTLYPKVAPLLNETAALPPSDGAHPPRFGRYVRITLPGARTLTLAEVEVYAGGKNVARGGTASQINTAAGGEASRGIDGNTSPNYGDHGQTHTNQNVQNPWWEVDLRREHPIESIVVFNRGEGLESRLEGFTLRVLDAQRNEVFAAKNLPAPTHKAAFRLNNGEIGGAIRRAAIEALATVRGLCWHNWSVTTWIGRRPSALCSRSRAPTGLPRRRRRWWTTSCPTSAAYRCKSGLPRPRWTPCNWPMPWPRSCRQKRGGRFGLNWASWEFRCCGSRPCPIAWPTTRSGWPCRQAARWKSSLRTPTSCRTIL